MVLLSASGTNGIPLRIDKIQSNLKSLRELLPQLIVTMPSENGKPIHFANAWRHITYTKSRLPNQKNS